MGRKIKKAITVVIAGMIIGSQFADMSAVGSIVQAEAGDHREAEKETDPEEDKDENKNPEEVKIRDIKIRKEQKWGKLRNVQHILRNVLCTERCFKR